MLLTKVTKVDITSWYPEALFEEVCELATPLAISLRFRPMFLSLRDHVRGVWITNERIQMRTSDRHEKRRTSRYYAIYAHRC